MHDHRRARGWHGPPGPFVRRRLLFGGVLFLLFATVVGVVGGLIVAAVSRPGPWLVVLLVPLVSIPIIGRRTIGRTLRPVGDLIDATVRMGDGESGVRVDDRARGPLRSVLVSFNRMAQRLDDEDERRRRFLSDIGHELKTPLAVLRGEIEALVDGVRPADQVHLESLLDDVDTVERLVEDLRTLTLMDAGRLELHLEEVDVGRLVGDALHSAASLADEQGVTTHLRAEEGIIAEVDPMRIRQIVWNLVGNALKAMPDGGTLDATARRTDNGIEIVIADTGHGIDARELESIFDRFVKSSDSVGSGLGLSIVRDLVEAHGGTIEAGNRPNGGATFTVDLPGRRT
jgi:two-component system sensor histidine kinase BaeS